MEELPVAADGNPNDAWVCPNDRQLALRAKLHSGWSVKTKQINSPHLGRVHGHSPVTTQSISQTEQNSVFQVIQRAEQLVSNEQKRIGKLIDRMQNIEKNAVGDGKNQCVLCGDMPSLFSSPHVICRDCNKAVCSKCSVDTSLQPREPHYLCKLCSERRETWKKSGAWFYKV